MAAYHTNGNRYELQSTSSVLVFTGYFSDCCFVRLFGFAFFFWFWPINILYYLLHPDCGEEYILLYPDDTYQLTSPNWPDLYPDTSYCHWVIETHPGHKLLLHFTDFSLQYGDVLIINLDGPVHEPMPQAEGKVGLQNDVYYHSINFTGSVIPGDLLSEGSIVVISMITDESGRDRGFVLNIRDTDGSGMFVWIR